MKTRLLSCLCLVGAFAASALSAEPAAPVHATTVTKSAIKIGNGSFALVKGTKLEVIGREGDLLIVKYRSSQGKIPLADTDYMPETSLSEASPASVATMPAKQAPSPSAVKPAPAPPVSKPAAPPALSVDGKPTSTYGKAVQKAKQAAEANKGTHVDPTDEILDEKPKK